MPVVEGCIVAEKHLWDREATTMVLEGSNAGGAECVRRLVSHGDTARRVGCNQNGVRLARMQSVCQQFARHRTASKA